MNPYLCLVSLAASLLLGSCCCGLGMLWVTPYQQVAHANFYENLKAIYDPEIIAEEAPVEPEII